MAERHRRSWIEAGGERPADAAQAALLDAVFGGSRFLSQALIREPALVDSLLADGPDACLGRLMAASAEAATATEDTAALKSRLRLLKRRVATVIGLADIAGSWSLEQVTGALTALADHAVALGLRHLLGRAHRSGDLVLARPEEPETDCGVIVIGMGKLGAGELNYSSDIDLMVFFDPEKVDYRGRRSIQELFVAMVRELVQILEERTGDGYVFRTDLRLRPDPGATPVAMSILAAETYYESFGQNWERAAMIKARQIAGDRTAGNAFLRFLRPFIWRRHLDFAAIQDIHSIKRQINAHKGGGRIAVAGHNIKLGRGGIREIEFFAQTQQLIWGGREPGLRLTGTCDALAALVAAGHLEAPVAAQLTDAYQFLRRLEHRLQMIDDQQTQTLPAEPAPLEALARFFGFDDNDGFAQALTTVLQTVETHYAGLFEEAPALTARGNLVFTGTEADPETLKTLTAMGFQRAEAISAQIRGWHHGRVRATRSTRAREVLTELTPALLEALARTNDPDSAFLCFDRFLSQLPAGLQLFALFANNPMLLDLVAEIMGDAPRLAEILTARPSLLYAVLSGDFFDSPAGVQGLAADMRRSLDHAGDFQEVMDSARRWLNEQKFRIGIHTLRNLAEPTQSARHLSDLAEASLLALQPVVEAEFAAQHGSLPGSGLAIVAMGKMGSREMTANSDLDLILIYDMVDGVDGSDGPKPLAPGTYYARLTQRMINALTAKTAEGTLYEVDMRLRPSGNSGPIATSLAAFSEYQARSAWTWEHMALTRARAVTGTATQRQAIETVISTTLRSRRDPVTLLADVADMRRRMAAEHPARSPWDVKHLRGGLVDIEFIAQYLQLRWAHEQPSILHAGTGEALAEAIRLGVLAPLDGEQLLAAHRLWSAIQQVLRQTIEGGFSEETAPRRLKDLLVQTTGSIHFEGLRAAMDDSRNAVVEIYKRLIEKEAKT
ncbi:MAG TPA: bifunctional [glutamine synthetase] adenylyltransferase/[glutamine synthetase]-adenylyl-L-tyrosine phosphorylase [Rhodospirillaceae bacterium]|nr:bifunctional [glutamine synthetase] adenylyltransferase/[glutamine synthetase]-adenylyl-L-tyrosine phosphorylase [Rhodospirillaceae bacterium]